MAYIGYKFTDGTVKALRRKAGECWEATTNRALKAHYGPCTVDNVRHWVYGYRCGPDKTTAQEAIESMRYVTVPAY